MIKLSRTDLKILLSIFSGTNTVREIAQMLDISVPRISSASTALERSGFLTKDGRGPSMRLKFTDQVFMQHLKQLFSMNLQLDKILLGSGIPFLMTLMIPEMSGDRDFKFEIGLSRNNIQRMSGLSFRTIDRLKNQLISAAVIYERRGHYRISKPQKELRDFLQNYARYHAGTIINHISSNMNEFNNTVVQKFVAGGELILACHQELTKNGIEMAVTGITAMSQDRIQFLSNQYFYHYSIGHRQLRMEDYVIDTLLLGTSSAHNISYSMLYLQSIDEHIDRVYLKELSMIFNVTNIVDAILGYLDSFPNVGKDLPSHFPKVNEFRELCVLYGVELHEG